MVETMNTIDMTPFKRLVLNIGAVPSDFKDGLTYYELLAYLIQFMEKTLIPAINEQTEKYNELTEAFNTLKSYVDNYFENLDIQEEINNKLDEMAEDGTLAEIVTAYLNAKSILAYNTIAEMKAATNIIDGSFLATYGNQTVNDSQIEFYKVRPITSSDVVDEVTIFALSVSNTLVAEKMQNAKLNSIEAEIEELQNNKTNLDELNQKRLQGNFNTYGGYEKGTNLSVSINREDGRPQIMGFINPSDVATYVNRDASGFFVGARPNTPILNYNENDTVYTATTVQCPSMTDEFAEYLDAMDLTDTVLDTYNVASTGIIRYSALFDSFDKATKTFTVKGGWYGVPSDGLQTYTPSNGTGIYLGLCTKVWGGNIAVTLPSDNRCLSSTGLELEIINHRAGAQDNCVLDLIGNPDEGADYAVQHGIKIRGKNSGKTVSNAITLYNIGYSAINSHFEKVADKYIILNTDSNNVITYYQKPNGRRSSLAFDQNLINSYTSTLDASKGYKAYNIANYDARRLDFHSPAYDTGRMYIVQNAMNVQLNLQYENGGGATAQLNIPASTTKILLSDGYSWRIVNA